MLFELAQRSFFCFVNLIKKSICFHKKETFLEVSSISLKTFYDKPIILKKATKVSPPIASVSLVLTINKR